MLCINFHKIVSDSVLHASHASIHMLTHVHEYRKEKLKKYLLFIEDYSTFTKGRTFALLKHRQKHVIENSPKLTGM